MYLPQLEEIQAKREMIDVFKGYNHNPRIKEGEFYDMQNLSSDYYPVISPRSKRGVYKSDINPHLLIAKDGICYVDGGELIYHRSGQSNSKSTNGLELTLTDDTQIVAMGAYIIIVNNIKKVWINTNDMSFGDIEKEFVAKSAKVLLCNLDGDIYSNISTVKPSNPTDQFVWIDTNTTPYSSYVYYADEENWQLTKTYIGIKASGLGEAFEIGDSIKLVTKVGDNEPDLNKSITIANIIEDWIIVEGTIKQNYSNEIDILLVRKIPKMDFIIESGNRLWGCRCGENNDGKIVNEIYASKLGDFKNWYTYQGISTDSYAVSVGSDGEFTGAISHLGYPVFFKENCMHKIYGSQPSNYQLQTTQCRGVQKGSHKSLAIVNEVLYYKSRGGICVYDGSLPSEISQEFGTLRYSEAVAGTLNNKYYVSMLADDRSTDVDKEYDLFVYDSAYGTWYKENSNKIVSFAAYNGNLYYIDTENPNQIKTVICNGESCEKIVKWSFETGIIGLENPDSSYISKLNIRASLSVYSSVNIMIKYNSMGNWEFVGKMVGSNLSSYNLPIVPKRCDHFQLKFEGSGDAKIYSICKTIEQGGQ